MEFVGTFHTFGNFLLFIFLCSWLAQNASTWSIIYHRNLIMQKRKGLARLLTCSIEHNRTWNPGENIHPVQQGRNGIYHLILYGLGQIISKNVSVSNLVAAGWVKASHQIFPETHIYIIGCAVSDCAPKFFRASRYPYGIQNNAQKSVRQIADSHIILADASTPHFSAKMVCRMSSTP